ncbi:LacI family DNA-binding transcriptional regulator [Alloyangia pacifica]|uniref:LacI family transcriptional regulator n=1 Tax=Alloyangia pacifica TaxID=311180 RepID=A0A1I6WKI6_9RHOB|nr:LacI family DNA-binding transcriptional regulator [Alloyangia pacifica]SDI85103.1 LacI family transcriptional regulator [Alloyangia pacifica]SFT26499.1 LacI family transcriptional regulator [Alloyangia pacifica]
MQRITNKALAEAAGVSVSTVDRIMTGRLPVKRATVEHVLEIAEEVSFHGVGVIRSRLRTEAPHCRIGLLLNARTRRTFLDMADRAQATAESSHDVQARVITHHLTHPEPEATVAALVDLAQRCDVIACHCIDHPQVHAAIEDLNRKGVPVLPVISGLGCPAAPGLVGSNEIELGRTAAWFMSRLGGPEGSIGLVNGGTLFRNQWAEEEGFRTFLKEKGSRLSVLPALSSGECDIGAARAVSTLLGKAGSRLHGVFVIGGGLEGAVNALRDARRPDILVVGNELTSATRAMLKAGQVHVILEHPGLEIMDGAIMAIAEWATGAGEALAKKREFPFRILLSENC